MVAAMDKDFNRRSQKPLRQDLRRHPTAAEAVLWRHLKSSQSGAKFRRQQGVGPFIVDFYCPSHSLVIELDGDSHEDHLRQDLRRQEYIEAQGLRVLRFRNEDVLKEIEAVLAAIGDALT